MQPVYNSNYQMLLLNGWNYISVSLRTILVGSAEKYEQVLALAQTNFGSVYLAGYDNTQSTVTYTAFTNTIYLGAYNDNNPQSFTGYMKEFKLFTVFHGFKQIQDE